MPDTPQEPLPVLVSACLMGCECRYDGAENEDHALARLLEERGEVVHAFCPEEAGGLSTPRPPAYLTGPVESVLSGVQRVQTVDGDDVSAAFLRGAKKALELCREHGIRRAYLKEHSPSCGVASTHIQGQRAASSGVTALFLRRAGIETLGIEGRRP